MNTQTREVIPNLMSLAVEQNKISKLPPLCILIRHDGSELPIEDSCAPIRARDGRITGAVMVFQDVSEARVLSQKLAHQALHDSLTGLPNRALLSDRLALAVAAAHRHKSTFALLYLDVDRFKHINDSQCLSSRKELRRATNCLYLQAQHCNEAQGYLFSPPVTADEFALVVERSHDHKS